MKLLFIKSLTVALLSSTLFAQETLEIPIWQAASEGDIELVKKHLSDGVNVKDDFGKTPIDGAIYTRKVLLKHGGKKLRLPPFSDHGSAFLRWNLPCPSSVL